MALKKALKRDLFSTFCFLIKAANYAYVLRLIKSKHAFGQPRLTTRNEVGKWLEFRFKFFCVIFPTYLANGHVSETICPIVLKLL